MTVVAFVLGGVAWGVGVLSGAIFSLVHLFFMSVIVRRFVTGQLGGVALMLPIKSLAAGFGLIGYTFGKLNCEAAPLLLGFVLGPMMEENLRRALLLSRGDPSVFVTRPISATLLVLAVLLLAIVLAPAVRKKREEAFVEEE